MIAEAALNEAEAHLYGPVLGLPDLREEVARQFSAAYGGEVTAAHVGITSGCNQAFCAAIAAICTDGDEVLLPTPWYFNHKMWLDMAGVRRPCHCPPGPICCPTLSRPPPSLLSDRSRAIILVTPNNPAAWNTLPIWWHFYRLAQSRGIKLIVDETYRDFDSPHGRAA